MKKTTPPTIGMSEWRKLIEENLTQPTDKIPLGWFSSEQIRESLGEFSIITVRQKLLQLHKLGKVERKKFRVGGQYRSNLSWFYHIPDLSKLKKS